MKQILWLALFPFVSHATSFEPTLLSASHFSACAVDEMGLWCGGLEGTLSDSQRNLPLLHNPIAMEFTPSYGCAIDEGTVKCWGYLDKSLLNFPALKNPRALSVDYRYICALDDEGVKCWGDLQRGALAPPALKHPRFLMSNLPCAIDDDGLRCWGEWAGRIERAPLRNPSFVTAKDDRVCGIDTDGVTCWNVSRYDREHQYRVADLKEPTSVAISSGAGCATTAEGVRCWSIYTGEPLPVPALEPVRKISGGTFEICATQLTGVLCWGYDAFKNYEKVGPHYFSRLQSDLGGFLAVAETGSSPLRAKVLRSLLAFYRTELSGEAQEAARIHLAELLAPLVDSGDSFFYRERVQPAFRENMRRIAERRANGKAPPLDLALGRVISWNVIRVALTAGADLLPVADREGIAASLRLVGVAAADPLDGQKLQAALQGVEALPALARFTMNYKSAFLSDTIRAAQAYLRSNL